MAVYCDADKLTRYFDERTIRDLLSDTGQPVAAGSASLAADVKLLEILKSASGRLEAACLISENYTLEELAAMSENSKALAAEICANLAMAMLMRRRPERYKAETIVAMSKDAEDYLQQLRNGARLFDVGKHAEAGKPELTYPSVAQIQNENAITMRTKNFYPNPTARLPISRGGG
jgi:hypothetical protein